LLNKREKNHPASVGKRFIFKCIKELTQRKNPAKSECTDGRASHVPKEHPPCSVLMHSRQPDTAKLLVLNSL
jgi:hypothetical protein